MDKDKLRGKIYGKFRNQSAFADHIGWNRQRLHNIVSGRKVPNVTDIKEIAEGLELTNDELLQIFLVELSQKW